MAPSQPRGNPNDVRALVREGGRGIATPSSWREGTRAGTVDAEVECNRVNSTARLRFGDRAWDHGAVGSERFDPDYRKLSGLREVMLFPGTGVLTSPGVNDGIHASSCGRVGVRRGSVRGSPVRRASAGFSEIKGNQRDQGCGEQEDRVHCVLLCSVLRLSSSLHLLVE